MDTDRSLPVLIRVNPCPSVVKEISVGCDGFRSRRFPKAMNPYFHLVSEYARFAREGRTYPLGAFASLPRPQIPPDAPKVLVFSPHPDDEVIIGGLALRLLREAKWNVINVAVTQGSNRSEEHTSELQSPYVISY